MVGENNGSGQTDSPFHHGSSMQPWTQAQSRPPHHQDAEKGQFYFQRAPEFSSDDQSKNQSFYLFVLIYIIIIFTYLCLL